MLLSYQQPNPLYSKNVIYLIQCINCNKQYIGQTAQPLKSRLARHIQKIRNPSETGVLQDHFRPQKCSTINQLALQTLDSVNPMGKTPQQIERDLKRKETLWIKRLRSEHPQGLNQIQYDATNRYQQ